MKINVTEDRFESMIKVIMKEIKAEMLRKLDVNCEQDKEEMFRKIDKRSEKS